MVVSVSDFTQRREVRVKGGDKRDPGIGVMVPGCLLKDRGSGEGEDSLDGLLDFGRAMTPSN
jgi:hypothetical protein